MRKCGLWTAALKFGVCGAFLLHCCQRYDKQGIVLLVMQPKQDWIDFYREKVPKLEYKR